MRETNRTRNRVWLCWVSCILGVLNKAFQVSVVIVAPFRERSEKFLQFCVEVYGRFFFPNFREASFIKKKQRWCQKSKSNFEERVRQTKMSFATPSKASNSSPGSPLTGLMKLMSGDNPGLSGTSNQSLTCPLCRHPLKNPRVLPTCLHSFCLLCLQLHVGKSRHFFCPVCQQVLDSFPPEQPQWCNDFRYNDTA